MNSKVGQVLEALAAGSARIGLVLCMRPLVHGQVRELAEALPAGSAGVGPFTRVGALVFV